MATAFSGPETNRIRYLQEFIDDVTGMLKEKEAHYGHDGGFFSSNSPNADEQGYNHALGEAKLKLFEFAKTRRRRDLIKAATWIYLILEAEAQYGPK